MILLHVHVPDILVCYKSLSLSLSHTHTHTHTTTHRDNLILDNIYGLLVVFLSLVGFISLAWLRDQLLHGGAPAWLARDQRAADQQRMRETHDSMDLLRIHLEQSSKRAKERAKEPDRVAAAAELTELHDRLNVEVKKLQVHVGIKKQRRGGTHSHTELVNRLSTPDHSALIIHTVQNLAA